MMTTTTTPKPKPVPLGWRANPENGALTQEREHGYVWTTNCRKCGTTQRVRLGGLNLVAAQAAVNQIDGIPQECPGGYHMELSGWRQLWSLDLMLARLANEIPPV